MSSWHVQIGPLSVLKSWFASTYVRDAQLPSEVAPSRGFVQQMPKLHQRLEQTEGAPCLRVEFFSNGLPVPTGIHAYSGVHFSNLGYRLRGKEVGP